MIKGEPAGVVVGDPVAPRVSTGWVKVDQLDLLIDLQPLDSVVELKAPYPIAAGAVVGYLGEYQRYREASMLPPAPQRSLMHLEVFAGPGLPAFIKKSQAHAVTAHGICVLTKDGEGVAPIMAMIGACDDQ